MRFSNTLQLVVPHARNNQYTLAIHNSEMEMVLILMQMAVTL